MKIIHFIPSIDQITGGTGAYIQLLAKELGKLCELYVVTATSDNPLEIENAKVVYIPCSWTQPAKMNAAWNKLLQNIRPDIVHVNGCWLPQCVWAQRWAQKAGYKVVLTPHGMLEPWIIKRHYWTRKLPALLFYQKAAIKKADIIHATAEKEKENLLKLGYNPNIEIIPNGIDVDNIRMKNSWKRNKNILFLSRVHVKKGINFLIEAAAQLKEDLDRYMVKIVGLGEEGYINELKTLTNNLGIGDMVEFVGPIFGDAKFDLYREADVFVLPTHSENFGIVVAEALASGTPVITTQGTPWKELESCHCGWWTKVGTEPTVNALRKFLALKEEELKEMGIYGRKLVETKYSSRKMAENMVNMYSIMQKKNHEFVHCLQ